MASAVNIKLHTQLPAKSFGDFSGIFLSMKLIEIKSQAQLEMLQKCLADPVEARRRGMTVEQVKASLEAHGGGGRLPGRLGPERPNRHGKR
jgi:hypothetical protein